MRKTQDRTHFFIGHRLGKLGNEELALNGNGQATTHGSNDSNSMRFSTKTKSQFFFNQCMSQAVKWEIAFAHRRAFKEQLFFMETRHFIHFESTQDIGHFETSHLIISCGERHSGTDQAHTEPETCKQNYLETVFMPIPCFLKRTKIKKIVLIKSCEGAFGFC